MTDETPTGLLHLQHRSLVLVIAIYAALTVAVLAIPVLVVQPRGTSSHLTQQEAQSTQAAPGRHP